MTNYQHDMMHCSQRECKRRDTCYRYWLGEHIKESGFRCASYYYPQEPVIDGCEHYLTMEEQQ